jgi:hypothetical protein
LRERGDEKIISQIMSATMGFITSALVSRDHMIGTWPKSATVISLGLSVLHTVQGWQRQRGTKREGVRVLCPEKGVGLS